MTDEQRKEEIRFTQETKTPHGCGDQTQGPSCSQELDGTCKRRSCAYFGLTAAKLRRNK